MYLHHCNTAGLPMHLRDICEWAKDRRFHQLSKVAVGARVVLTSNIDIKSGAVNGAVAIVTAVHLETNSEIVRRICRARHK